ncbi:MAG: type IV secretory system conjugative DNA transfer family protein [Planctomycetaceae bacterium]|nr:type IV secretory system conjugative DNA transfer family protein [Planctomycetaceae bacterium]
MHADCPRKTDVVAAQTQFFVSAGLCVATVVTIHWLPKHVPQPFRLGYTVGYFAALLCLLYQFVGPLRRYLLLLYSWRYESAPEPLERAWKSLLFSLNQLIAVPCFLLGAFLSSVGLITISMWLPDLGVLSPLYNLVWWLSLIGFVLFPVFGGFLFHECAQKHRQLSYETELSRSFTPRPVGDLLNDSPDGGTPLPLAILDGLKFQAGGHDWEWNDFVQNCVVFGQIGSGKTSCVLNSVLDGLFGSAAQAGQKPSGLILDPKGTFFRDVEALCLRYQRRQDLLVLDPDDASGVCWNPFDSADDEYELATRFAAVSRSLGTKDSNSSFWITKSTMFIQYALELLRLTNPPGEPPCFAQINELASSFAAISERADRLDVTDPRGHDCLAFFATEWATMAPETRTSVQAHLTGMLFPFLKQPYATRFAGRSTHRIADMIDNGKILYLHMPTSDRETMARTIGIFLKLEYYREVLRRPRKKRPSFFFCDEFQKFFTAGSKENQEQDKSDADTFRLSRESFHANIVATQNIGALGSPEAARAFLGNCLTGIFLRNPDEATNAFTSQLFGQDLIGIDGVSSAVGGRGWFKPVNAQQISSNVQFHARCPADRFRELSICSREQPEPHCESIVFLGGRDERPLPIRKLKWKRHPLSVS